MNRKRCSSCKNILIFSTTFDSLLCPICDVWLEPGCNDPDCCFCSERPEYPSHTGWLLEEKNKNRISSFQRKSFRQAYWVRKKASKIAEKKNIKWRKPVLINKKFRKILKRGQRQKNKIVLRLTTDYELITLSIFRRNKFNRFTKKTE